MCCRDAGAEGVGQHWLIRLVNAKALMKEGEGNKIRRATDVQTVTGHGCGSE